MGGWNIPMKDLQNLLCHVCCLRVGRYRAFIHKVASVVYILWAYGYCTRRSIKLDSAVRNMEMASDRGKTYTSHTHTFATYCTVPTSDVHTHTRHVLHL